MAVFASFPGGTSSTYLSPTYLYTAEKISRFLENSNKSFTNLEPELKKKATIHRISHLGILIVIDSKIIIDHYNNVENCKMV